MPRVKIRLATGVVVPSRRRAGLQIYAGQPQEFDVTDEQYLTLLDDNKLQVTQIADEESTDEDETQDDNQDGDETQTDPAANTQSAQGAQEANTEDEGGETQTGNDEDVQTASDEAGDDAELPKIPTTESAIKKQGRDIVVAQAQSLGIELDYADEAKTTKAVIAAAIIAKQKEA